MEAFRSGSTVDASTFDRDGSACLDLSLCHGVIVAIIFIVDWLRCSIHGAHRGDVPEGHASKCGHRKVHGTYVECSPR